VTLVIDGEVRPVLARLKIPVVTPVTGSLNVTVQVTLDALVGLAEPRTIEVTVGAVLSIV
jgi:hypothetical protein